MICMIDGIEEEWGYYRKECNETATHYLIEAELDDEDDHWVIGCLDTVPADHVPASLWTGIYFPLCYKHALEDLLRHDMDVFSHYGVTF